MGVSKRLEGPLEYITLQRAEELCGVSAGALRNQVKRKRLRTVKLGRDNVTTRVWLHEYLTSRDPRGRVKPLPADYVAPE
jgi:hypothetical protein